MHDGYYNSQILFGFDRELDEAEKKSQGNRKRKKSQELDEANTSAQSLPENQRAVIFSARKSARKSPVPGP